MQLQIDWDNISHTQENNKASEEVLFEEYDRLNKQCKKVYDLLNSGVVLSVKSAILDYDISSLPRRLKDLKEKGIHIDEVTLEHGIKNWFIKK